MTLRVVVAEMKSLGPFEPAPNMVLLVVCDLAFAPYSLVLAESLKVPLIFIESSADS